MNKICLVIICLLFSGRAMTQTNTFLPQEPPVTSGAINIVTSSLEEADGIYVQNTMLMKGDTTGPVSSEFILRDPTVEFAVLETARGGILRAGLGFNRCDIGVITNIQADHLGISDIHTLDDLARVKGVVIGAVKRSGWGVLNADNKYCIKIAASADCNVAYFSMDENNPVIVEHCKKGGIAAIYENGYITIKKGDWKIRVEKVTHVPLTFGGSVDFMIRWGLVLIF
jgi:cyanophycin synthetase